MYEYELNRLLTLYRNGLFSKKYYKDRIKGENSFSSYDEFCKIPLMDKQSIRETAVFERTNTSKSDVYGIFSSSGTTGDKTFYVYNKNDKKVHEEFVRTFFDELDISSDDIGGVMAPVGTGVMAHTMLWEFSTVGAGYVNCPEPSPINMIEIIEKIPVTVIATRPNIASSIAYNPELCSIAQGSSVKKLAVGGGFLSNARRKMIEVAWGAECFNCFGMSEMFGPMAAECREKNGLHYLDKYLMIELLDPISKMPVPEGQPGIAVYTSLWEKGFPLLRYWTDDLMIVDRSKCKCGSSNPRIRYLGRMADCIILDGTYIFPEQVENILFDNGFIGEYKVIQDYDQITVFTETPEKKDIIIIQALLEELFLHRKVNISLVPIGKLNYKGLGKRFECK